MRKIICITGVSAVFSMLALAGSWSGNLLDAGCYEQRKEANACPASGNTTSFALEAGGKIFKFDAAGNSKAAQALKNRADRSTNPSAQPNSAVAADVKGTEKEGVIAVETIDVR